MPRFGKENTREGSGGKFHDKDWTVNDAKWKVETKGGFVGIFFSADLEDATGHSETKDWLLGGAEALSKKLRVNDDGQLEDVDADNPYVPRKTDETSVFFNSAEDAGVPSRVLDAIGEAPEGLIGYTFHLVERPTGKKQVKKDPKTGQKVETQYDQTILVVDEGGLVASPGKGAAKGSAKSTAAAAPTGAKKGKPAPEPEPDDDEDEVDPIEAAAVATIQRVLETPKKFVATYNAKQNDGGVTTGQMRTAALGNAVPKEYSGSKPQVAKMLAKPDVYEKYNGELWSWDADSGVVSALDE